MPAWPVRIDGKPPEVTSFPVLGEHTDAVPGEWLGLNGQAAATLRAEGAV
jgi:crotonobetainyl-CoA:carnitine CoA-transferase CaiB-like acyl-CoA transferase